MLLSAVAHPRHVVLHRCCWIMLALSTAGCGASTEPGANAVGAPTLTDVSPATVTAGSGDVVVEITGTGFGPSTNAVATTNLVGLTTRVISPTSMVATVPESLLTVPTTLRIYALNAVQGGGLSQPLTISVQVPLPVITALRPQTAPVGLTTLTLAVDGTGFLDSSVVQVNGVARRTRRAARGTLEIVLTEADLSEVGALQIAVSNAALGGGRSEPAVFTVTGAIPEISLLPATGGTVGGGFSLGVHGTGFARNSVVRWNGADLPTNFANGRRLFAQVPDAAMASAGVVSIAVFSPGTGGGTSNVVPFTIRPRVSASGVSQVVPIEAADVAFSAKTGTLFATVGRGDATYPNRLVEIDPASGSVLRSVAIGTDPNLLAMADDGSMLYVGVDGENSVRRVDLTTFVPGLQLRLEGATYAADIAVLPGRPRSVAVSRYSRGVSPPFAGTTVYDDGVARPIQSGTFTTMSSRIEFAGIDTLLFGYNSVSTGYNLYTIDVSAAGQRTVRDFGGLLEGFSTEIIGASGRLYTNYGDVVDPELQAKVGGLPPAYALYVDPARGRAYRMLGGRIDVLDINTFTTIVTVPIPEAIGSVDSGWVYRIVRCGAECLAWADGSRMVIARSASFGG